MSLEEWLDKVEIDVAIQSVPGMGQFDIDGLEPSQQVCVCECWRACLCVCDTTRDSAK